MALRLLLDAHIAPAVAAGVTARRPVCFITSVVHWRDGRFRTASDWDILRSAATEKLTLVSYDLQTIPTLLEDTALDPSHGFGHGGVLLVDGRSIAQTDIGGQVRALVNLWDENGNDEWTNVVRYLKPA